MHIPDDGSARFVTLPRQAIERLRLRQSESGDAVLAETGIGQESEDSRWPDSFILPVPRTARGETTLFLEVQGLAHLNLQPSLISEEQRREQSDASRRFYDLLYGTLFLVGMAALVRRWTSGDRTLRVALAAFTCLFAGIVGNYHLLLTLGGISLASISALPAALWALACAPLLWATQQYAGHDRNHRALAVAVDRTGFALLIVGAAMLALPPPWLPSLQRGSVMLLAATALICAACLSYDARQWRWGPITVWLAVVLALAAIPLGFMQFMSASLLSRNGFQLLIALQVAIYLLLPWIRQSLQERAKLKRVVDLTPSTEEKIAHAREWMLASLRAGIENSVDDGDMEWIVYRRLMAGLKTVLPQSSAAVIAMNYHNEDLLLVEPGSAEPSFRALLGQRGSLLKNLSRSLAPQQIGVDLKDLDGSSRHVLLAVIPLPIERPGWGLLVIERSPQESYSDDELDMCTEFAALATTAGDEAAEAMQARQANEIDPETGVLKREMIEQILQHAPALAIKKRTQLSMLRIHLEGFDALPADAGSELLRPLADLIREEIDYGDSIGRFSDDEFMVLPQGKSVGEARTLAERICAAVRQRALSTGEDSVLQVSIGVSQLQPGETTAQFMLERAGKALGKARQYGGNQVQAIAGAV
jgi:diguanylate cyclase (GGDEF)-like protein